MALDKLKLRASLKNIFSHPDGISGTPDAIMRWTNAYHSYAMDAEDISTDRVLVTNQPGFLGSLVLNSGSSAIQAASEFDRAFVAYWTGAIFSVGIPIAVPPSQCPNIGGNLIWSTEITSLVITVIPGILAGLLGPEFLSFSDNDTPDSKANVIATAFHNATMMAVLVLITGIDTTPPPVGPLPIINTCTIR